MQAQDDVTPVFVGIAHVLTHKHKVWLERSEEGNGIRISLKDPK